MDEQAEIFERGFIDLQENAPITESTEELLKQRDDLRDCILRLQADFENYRKRIASQTGLEIDRGSGRTIESLLPTLDALDAAIVHGNLEAEPIRALLLGALQTQGLETLDLKGKIFDPTYSQAMIHEPGVTDKCIITEILRPGYCFRGQVLRAALVKVRG
jgi:molecular chaperone GrpE